jgi:hypothetical protein
MYNQQQLPYDPENLMWQTGYINVENPPYVPNVNVDQRVGNFLPVICGLLMQEIQNNAQPGRPLRIFMYNKYADNNWANEHFARTAAGIADWFVMAMETGQYRNEVDCLSDIVPKMAELAAATQLREYPALEGYIDANMHNVTVQLINNLDGIAHQVQSYMARQQGGNQWQRGGQGGGWADRQRDNWQNRGGQRSTGSSMGGWEGNTQRQPARPAEAFGSGGTNLFSGRQAGGDRWKAGSQAESGDTRFDRAHAERQTASRSTDVEASSGSKADDGFNAGWRTNKAAKTAPKSDTVEITQTGSTPALNKGTFTEKIEEPVEVLADKVMGDGMRWRPSLDQPYPLAYNPRTHLLYLRRESKNAAVIQVLKERKEGSVDYEKHKIVRTFGPAHRQISAEENQRRLENMRAALEPKSLDDPTLDEVARALLKNRVLDEAWIMETSQELAWVVGSVGQHVAATENGIPDIYHRRAKIATPVLGAEDQSAMIRELGACETFEALKLKMLALGPKMHPELFRLAESKMTDAVNRILVQRMSIDDIRIGSFLEDVTDLLPVIGSSYGRVFIDAFNSAALETIKATFQAFDDDETTREEVRLMTDNILASYEGDAIASLKFTYLVSNVTMTHLSCLAQELEVELDPKKAVLVTVNTPFMRELVEDIMHNVAVFEDVAFERHFIRTADGRILEITRGLLGADSLLLRCVR